jgi:L-threonylcarbamoyladenylate synthase
VAIIQPNESGISIAATLIRNGDLVAFPTETVYGLGADATQTNAIGKIYKLKGRPQTNPLIVHVGQRSWLSGIAMPDGRVDILTNNFWPGPLTLILERRSDSPVCSSLSSDLTTVAVRQPDHPIAKKLLMHSKRPIAAPSANISGHVSSTSPQHVLNDFGEKVKVILDGGKSDMGLESTVLDLTSHKARILRHGMISSESIAALIGEIDDPGVPGVVLDQRMSPGQLEKHYAPSLPVRMNVTEVKEGEALIGFGNTKNAIGDLSKDGNLNQAARNLFAVLREFDDPAQFTSIAFTPIPCVGVGKAINDRLRKASKGR